MPRPCWAYMEPMLDLCWSMLGSWRLCWGHIGAMLSLGKAKNGVFLLSLCSAQKEHVVFGSCQDHVAYMEPMPGLCWSMLGSWRLCWGHIAAMLSLCYESQPDKLASCFCGRFERVGGLGGPLTNVSIFGASVDVLGGFCFGWVLETFCRVMYQVAKGSRWVSIPPWCVILGLNR